MTLRPPQRSSPLARLRIGSEDPPASRMNTLSFIAEFEPFTDRQPSGQRPVAGLPSSRLHFRTSPASTTDAFRRRQSRTPSTCPQQVACDALPFIHSQAGRPGREVPDIASEGRRSCLAARKVAPSHCVFMNAVWMVVSDIRKRLSAELLQNLPLRHRLLGAVTFTSPQLTGTPKHARSRECLAR